MGPKFWHIIPFWVALYRLRLVSVKNFCGRPCGSLVRRSLRVLNYRIEGSKLLWLKMRLNIVDFFQTFWDRIDNQAKSGTKKSVYWNEIIGQQKIRNVSIRFRRPIDTSLNSWYHRSKFVEHHFLWKNILFHQLRFYAMIFLLS